MADVSVVVMIDVDLPALTSFIRSHKDTTVRAPVGTQGKFEFEFRKFLIAQQQAAISRPGRVLFTKEQPVLSDAPVSPVPCWPFSCCLCQPARLFPSKRVGDEVVFPSSAAIGVSTSVASSNAIANGGEGSLIMAR